MSCRFVPRACDRWRGQAVAEYAIALIIFVPVLVGIVDLGRGYFEYAELANSVNEGARYATLDKSETNIKNRVKARDYTVGLTDGDITVTCYSGSTTTTKTCSSVVVNDTIKVTAQKVFTPITTRAIDFIGGGTITLRATAQRTFQ